MKSLTSPAALLAFLILFTGTLHAGQAEVVDATATLMPDGSYRIAVTLRHADSGWEHYADRWDVLDETGTVIDSRTLHHPHVEEQPFTRSLDGVRIPLSTSKIRIRAHDKVHGDSDTLFTLEVPR